MPVSWNQLRNWANYSRGYSPPSGMGQGGGMAGMAGRQQRPPGWFPELYSQLYQRIGGEEEESFGRLRDLMGYNVGQLGKSLSANLGRMNMPIGGSTDMLARRFLGPMQTQMEHWMGTQKMSFQEKAGTALGMAQQFSPMFEPHLGKDYWKSVMNNFMKQLFGGGK